jgi:hypothetical protein
LLAKSYVYYILFGGRLWKDLSYTVSRSFVFIRDARSIDKVSTGDLLAYFRDLYRLTKLNRHATTQSLVQFSFFHYFPEKINQSMKLVEYTLARFQDEQVIRPFRLVLVPIPTRFQIEGNKLQALKSRVGKKCRYVTSLQPETLENTLFDSLARMAAGMKMEMIDLRPAMSAKAGEGKLYFDSDFHINPAAHDIIGHEIAAHLDSTGYTQAGR